MHCICVVMALAAQQLFVGSIPAYLSEENVFRELGAYGIHPMKLLLRTGANSKDQFALATFASKQLTKVVLERVLKESLVWSNGKQMVIRPANGEKEYEGRRQDVGSTKVEQPAWIEKARARSQLLNSTTASQKDWDRQWAKKKQTTDDVELVGVNIPVVPVVVKEEAEEKEEDPVEERKRPQKTSEVTKIAKVAADYPGGVTMVKQLLAYADATQKHAWEVREAKIQETVDVVMKKFAEDTVGQKVIIGDKDFEITAKRLIRKREEVTAKVNALVEEQEAQDAHEEWARTMAKVKPWIEKRAASQSAASSGIASSTASSSSCNLNVQEDVVPEGRGNFCWQDVVEVPTGRGNFKKKWAWKQDGIQVPIGSGKGPYKHANPQDF